MLGRVKRSAKVIGDSICVYALGLDIKYIHSAIFMWGLVISGF